MTISLRFTRAAAFVCVLIITAAACTDEGEVAPIVGPEFAAVHAQGGQAKAFEVYTQNLFLGGDTGPLFSLDFSDPGAIGEVIAATSAFYQEMLASNIPERVTEFVNEIDERRPDVVALQEAVGYATGLLNLATFQFTPTAPGPDLLDAVMKEIKARDLPYEIAVIQPTTAIALPIGPPGADFVAPGLGVQDRVVMLRHKDLEPVSTDKGVYTARLPLGPADVLRGWVRLSVERDGTPYHFVATHLETQGPGPTHPIRMVHDGQALELENVVLAGLEGHTVLMGDLNSDAAADPSAPSYTETYGKLVAAGFTDIWDVAPRRRSETGVTCCQADGDEPRVADQRIDFVLFRPAIPSEDSGNHRGWFRAEVLGNQDADRTTSGLWPSDHAGIAASIRLPNSLR